MQYQVEVDIDLPRAAVIEKFDNAENLKHWQRDLVSVEHISGTPGTRGAKTKLIYKMGGRKVEMVETITANDPPKAFHGTYEANGVFNIQENYFTEVNENKTKWTSKSEFKFNNFMMKLMGFLMPGSFKKQSLKYMTDFKNFAENGISVSNDQN
ncbi:SRPBCC family protein [Flavobacteriaceae bacterium M23B6Z8]